MKYEYLNKILSTPDLEKVSISKDDLFCFRLKTSDETTEFFGEDYLEEFGISVPISLIEKYQKVMEEYEQMQKELKKYYEESR